MSSCTDSRKELCNSSIDGTDDKDDDYQPMHEPLFYRVDASYDDEDESIQSLRRTTTTMM